MMSWVVTPGFPVESICTDCVKLDEAHTPSWAFGVDADALDSSRILSG
jgi:hypothetical protein